ncbi:(4Fe-4S)-binding protein [Spongiimicrobium sp. 3-5]|uniref:(4Fe-4S)-binding protein n=1 Tax=Spongiimicrobium sp. 3-5 TaxID=3332596 RepID=UPI0039808279
MRDITKKYTNGELTVVWKPKTCIHSTICFQGLPQVFNPNNRPWTNVEGASTKEIADQIDKCPSGALSYYYNDKPEAEKEVARETIVEVSLNGPLLVFGNITLKDSDGNETKKSKVTALCRCGASENKPYCDGKHQKIGFKG